MWLAAARQAEVTVEIVYANGGEAPESLWLQVNHVPVGAARAVRPVPVDPPDRTLHLAVFDVPASALRDGRNTLVLRNEGALLTLIALEVKVNPC